MNHVSFLSLLNNYQALLNYEGLMSNIDLITYSGLTRRLRLVVWRKPEGLAQERE